MCYTQTYKSCKMYTWTRVMGIHNAKKCSIEELSIEIQTFGGDSLENSFEDIFFAILLILIGKS